MAIPTYVSIRPRFVALALTLAALAASGCAGGVPVTPEALTAARETWAKADVRDYDLEWASIGQAPARYAVTVRDGAVKSIESIAPNGRRGVVKPAAPRFYSVDGLFTTIADELAQLDGDRPFGQPKGTTAVLRFKLDPKYGYPRFYRRDVMGSTLPMAIDVLKFEPTAR